MVIQQLVQTTGGGATDGGAVTPSGTITGAWFGTTGFGDGVMIIDAAGNVTALSANTSGQYETVFGPATGPLQRFLHRDSDNPAFADSFTLAGDLPSALSGNVADDTVTYSLSAINDGQSISNTGAAGDFSLTFATADDLSQVTLDSIAGAWTAKTSFCAADCNITLNMTFGADGSVNGSTQFNDGGTEPLTGTVTAAAGATQHLNITFTWTGKQRTGVLHVDRNDSTRLVLNTFGPSDTEGESKSFTARMIRR